MPPPVLFKDCSFEGNEIQVCINYNNNNTSNNYNYGASGYHSGATSDIPSEEQEQAEATPLQDLGNPAASRNDSSVATSDVPTHTQQAHNDDASGQGQHCASGHITPDPQSPPPPYDETEFFTAPFEVPTSLYGNIPRVDTPSSLVAERASSVSSFNSESEADLPSFNSQASTTSATSTAPKEARSGEEEREQLLNRAREEDNSDEDGEEEEDGDGENEEEEEEEDAVVREEKWETESKEKEGHQDLHPRELEDVMLSVDLAGGCSPSSPLPGAGPLSAGQQSGDQPNTLHSSPSAALSPAVPSTRQEQEEEQLQAQLTAELLCDLARDESHDEGMQDEKDPEMVARLERLRAEDPQEPGMSDGLHGSQVGKPTATVSPTEQAILPSSVDRCKPPQPPIELRVSPEEPIEGESVDFELLHVPLCGITNVEWKHNGICIQQAAGICYTINSISQKDAGVYQCIIREKSGVLAVVEVTLVVKNSTDVRGAPCLEEEGGSGGSNGKGRQHPGHRAGDARPQDGAALPTSPGSGSSKSTQQGSGEQAAETSVQRAAMDPPDYESLQQRYLQGRRLMAQDNHLLYHPFLDVEVPADQRDCVVMNAGDPHTNTPMQQMLEKLTAVTAEKVPQVPEKKPSPPNLTAPVNLSIERKDSAPYIRDGSNGQSSSCGEIEERDMDRPGASGRSDRRGADHHDSGPACPPRGRQEDAGCHDTCRSAPQLKKLPVSVQPHIDAVYYNIPLSELMDDADLLDEVKYKLDPDCQGRKNWRNLGAKFGIPRDQLEYFACHGRCTEAVLERVSSETPETSVGDLMNCLYQIKRGDVVETIKQNIST